MSLHVLSVCRNADLVYLLSYVIYYMSYMFYYVCVCLHVYACIVFYLVSSFLIFNVLLAIYDSIV